MGILNDVAEIARDFRSMRNELGNLDVNYKSLSKVASEAILQFPVICSKGISIEGMTLVTKAVERQYSSFILIVTSLYSVTDKKPTEYLRKWHQNRPDSLVKVLSDVVDIVDEATVTVQLDDIKSNALQEAFNSVLGYISPLGDIVTRTALIENVSLKYESEAAFNEAFDTVEGAEKRHTLSTLPKKFMPTLSKTMKKLKEDYDIIQFKEELMLLERGTRNVFGLKLFTDDNTISIIKSVGINGEKHFNRVTETGLTASNKRLLSEWESPFNEDILNDKSFNIPSKRVSHVMLSEKETVEITTRVVPGQQAVDGRKRPKWELDSKGNPRLDADGNRIPIYLPDRIDNTKKVTTSQDDVRDPQYDPEFGYLKSGLSYSRLSDNDVKKSNELVPTLLTIQQTYIDNKNISVPVSFNIGVKAIMHPVSSEEMVKNLSNGVTRNRNFFNFFRWTTGEINFWKDLVLTMDDIRDDVLSKFNGNSSWWTALKRRKLMAKMKRSFFFKSTQILPNATIVCTMEEVNFLKNEYGIDLFKNRISMLKVMEEYFLLGFCIVDESSELAYFLFDGEKEYQTYSFSSLERENTNKAKETRDIMRILSKM